MQIFGPQDSIPERPFAALTHSSRDLQIMNRMLADLRQQLPPVLAAQPAEPYQYLQSETADGTQHKLVLPNWPRLAQCELAVAVGFFGQARDDVDHSPIVALENELIERMGRNPGLLAYYNVFWPGTGWGNLVLFSDTASKKSWPENPPHPLAVELTPQHYHSIRLHTGVLPGRLLDPVDIELVKTKYLDFSDKQPWVGLRHYAAPAREGRSALYEP